MGKKGVGAIIYDDMGENYFLILHRNSNWEGWEFPKGGVNEGESSDQAIVREIREETGLTVLKAAKKMETGRNFVDNDGIEHNFDMYLIHASMNIPVKINTAEHDTFLWTTKDRVLEKLTWDTEKDTFKRALEEIKKV